MRKPMVTAEMMLRWEEGLGRFRPARIDENAGGGAVTILSFEASAAEDGVYLRVRTVGGAVVDIFLNAAVATQMADVIRQIGQAAVWMDEDGAIIVKDPENLAAPGRKS